jgi:putative transposase
MRETDIEVILNESRRSSRRQSLASSHNRPQFIARDFKEFIRISGMTHVRTSPYYPHSSGRFVGIKTKKEA